MELAGNLSVSISLPVSGQLGCRNIMPKVLAVMLTEFILRLTALIM
jgi:hypothetical protein